MKKSRKRFAGIPMVVLTLCLTLMADVWLVTAATPPAGPGKGPVMTLSAPSIRDAVYVAGSKDPLHKFDLYIPASPKPKEGYPLIVYVHGGGFVRGDKFGNEDSLANILTGLDRGYMIAAVNYRLAGTAKAPAQVVDVKAAIRHLKANAARYGIDTERMALFGVSAGASIAAAAAVTGGSPLFDAELSQLGADQASDTVKAAATLYGIYNFNTADRQYRWLVTVGDTSLDNKYPPAYAEYRKFFAGKPMKPFNAPNAGEYEVVGGPFKTHQAVVTKICAELQVAAQEPPFFIRHGTQDMAIPFLQAVEFSQALKAKGNQVDFALVEGAEHGLPGQNFWKVFKAQELFDWLKANL